MKICAIICEYNPFHNGHLYQLSEAKRLSGADATVCIMSGNFVQRGEAAVLEKYTRAKHAVLAGADAVIELPVPFATANAELFAKGAVKILSSVPDVTTLCFGAETADKQAFLKSATLLNDEPREISQKIKADLATGVSFAKARANAWTTYIPAEFLSSPNNALGIEYTRAILAQKSNVEILPISRVGSGYKEENLAKNYASATAIRKAIADGKSLGENLPDFVLSDLPNELENKLDSLEKYAVLSVTPTRLKEVCDCTEGLENAFIKAAALPERLTDTLTSARYTSSRVRRIALQNLLTIDEKLIRDCLRSPLYLKLLAIKKENRALLSALGKSPFPLLSRAHDEDELTGVAKACHEKDCFAESVYALLYPVPRKKNIFL